jgi:hypothetical protein
MKGVSTIPGTKAVDPILNREGCTFLRHTNGMWEHIPSLP